MKAIVIAGTTSGVGKTTIAIALMGILKARGLNVQPFKTGPDYIDPSYHTWVTGKPSRNLATWMLPHSSILELFHRAMTGNDIAVIEGVMGLYDGRSSCSDEGSTAELAKLLGAPVILVLDSRKGARSMAAMAAGYRNFDRDLHIGGVVLNGIGSQSHLKLCREAIEHYTDMKVLGYLSRNEDLSLPERYLGLIPTVEGPADKELLNKMIAHCNDTFDVDGILRLAERAAPPEVEPLLFPATNEPVKAGIAVAEDKAFSFYYRDSLDLLEAWGAELVSFSPMESAELPSNVSGLYIGGGFPELYAAELADNRAIKQAIKSAAERDMPLYAECGGLMYLGRSIRDAGERSHSMVGALPLSSRIDGPRLNLGYRTIQALADGPLLSQGETVRGHEFHWSVLEDSNLPPNAYRIIDGQERLEGFQNGNLIASYIHLHMGSLSSMAPRFVESCCRFKQDCQRRDWNEKG